MICGRRFVDPRVFFPLACFFIAAASPACNGTDNHVSDGPTAGDLYVYWSNSGPSSFSIGRAKLNDPENPLQGWIQGCEFPNGVAVDANHIYYSNLTEGPSGTMGRAELDGSGVNQIWVAGCQGPHGVAVDTNYVYWANQNTNSIARATRDGLEVDQVWITGCNTPYGVAVDASHIYWANADGDTVGRANLDGDGVNQGWISGCDKPGGLAVNADHIYWANIGTGIGRANIDGTAVDQNWCSGCAAPYGIAVYGEYIYWARVWNNEIGRAKLGDLPTDITLDWITQCDEPMYCTVGSM